MGRRTHNRPLIQRFLELIKINSSGCWEWQGNCIHRNDPTDTYPYFHDLENNKIRANRWSYEYFKGGIPEGYHVHHTCRNTICVNPTHLTIVTPKEHCKTMKNRYLYEIQDPPLLCKNKHELTKDTIFVYYSKAGYPAKGCKLCQNLKARERYYRNKGRSTVL